MKVLCVPRWMLGIMVNQLDTGSICKKVLCVCALVGILKIKLVLSTAKWVAVSGRKDGCISLPGLLLMRQEFLGDT